MLILCAEAIIQFANNQNDLKSVYGLLRLIALCVAIELQYDFAHALFLLAIATISGFS